jgi:ABC-type transport system substrate-binding protein
MRRSLVAATVASVLLLASACGGSDSGSSGSAGSSDTLTLAAVTPPKSFAVGEMAQSGPEDHYYQAVYDTLLKLDEDGQPAANLVADWSYDATGTRLSLTLRDDVTFSDGTPFDAAAVKANLEAAKTKTGEAGTALAAIASVEVVDATHADVVLSRPDPALEQSLARSSGYMASPAALSNPDLATDPVGSGPYVLDADASTAGSTYVYTRNEDYWNAEDFPYDSLEIRFLDDTTAILNGLRSGEVNGVSGGTSDVTTGAQNAGLTVTKYTNGGIEGVYLWDRDGALAPALGDVRVRQAINYAMDRETIVETVKGGLGEPTVQVFGPSSAAYDESLEDSYPYDVDKAKQLMAEAGYADGIDVTADFISRPEDTQNIQLYQQMLAKIGVRMTLQPSERVAWVQKMLSGDYEFGTFLSGVRPDPDLVLGYRFAKGGPGNYALWENPELDKLFEEGRTTYDTAKRQEAYEKASNIIGEEAYVGFVWRRSGAAATRKTVEGFIPVWNGVISSSTEYWLNR